MWIEFWTDHLLPAELCSSFSKAGSASVTNSWQWFAPHRPSHRRSWASLVWCCGCEQHCLPGRCSERLTHFTSHFTSSFQKISFSFLSRRKWALRFCSTAALFFFFLLVESVRLFPRLPDSLELFHLSKKSCSSHHMQSLPGTWGEDRTRGSFTSAGKESPLAVSKALPPWLGLPFQVESWEIRGEVGVWINTFLSRQRKL